MNCQIEQNIKNQNPILMPQHLSNLKNPWQSNSIQIEDPRVVKRIVNNLMYLFNIQAGDYITFVLGYGHCRSNEQALQSWVLEQLEDHQLKSKELLPYLVEKLKTQLNLEVYS